ncbi:hypothetical protein [Rhodovulum sp. YEN HP10]|uniref:hypothetical protein n=1 Tax=Rhodovulum sp. HP10 TaxID=3387397 RepID=UPI0039DFC89B
MVTMVSLLGVMAVGADRGAGALPHGEDGAGDRAGPDRATDALIAVMDLHAALGEPAPEIDGMSRADELLFSWLSGGPDIDDLPPLPDHAGDLLAGDDGHDPARAGPTAGPRLAEALPGAGTGLFSVQDLFEDGTPLPTVIDDYDQSTDALFVVYDSAAHPAPVLSIDATEVGDGDALIRIDGQPLAIVIGAGDTLRLGHLSLVPDTMLAEVLAAGA